MPQDHKFKFLLPLKFFDVALMELKDKFRKCLNRLRNKKNSNLEFQFISENPISEDDKETLSFGHKDIVNTIKDITLNCPESFTIGLYGDWGSGKSTIAFALQQELEKLDVPLVLFDVWKHEGDALRRTFIRQTHNYFKTNKNWRHKYNCKDEILDELTKSKREVIRKSMPILQIIKGAIVLPISYLVLALLVWLVLDVWLGLDYFKKDDIPNSIAVFLGLFPVSFLFKFTLKFIENIKGDKEEYYHDKIQDPIEFENKFKQIIKGLSTEIKKIVFVFDNLDRVSGEKAIQIMSTIKTFLNPIDKTISNKDIVFLIPCDETAIKRHLRRTLSYSKDFKGDEYHNYAGEYLRKFFNTIIWIPDFYTNELEKLANRKLKETKIKEFENDELAALIVLVFDKNPRQIIQFINILISNYLLVLKRSIEGFSLKDDIAKLAKYLLLIQRFPDIMESYKRNMIYKLEEAPPELDETEVNGYRKFSEKRVSEFRDFLKITEHVKIDSLDFFFKLRTGEFANQLKGSSRILRIIETNRINELTTIDKTANNDDLEVSLKNDFDFLLELEIEEKTHEFSQVINEKLRRMNNPVLIAKFVDGILFFTKFKEVRLEHKTYKMIYDKLNQHRAYASTIDPSNLILECHDKMRVEADKKRLKKMIGEIQVQDFIYSFPNSKV